MNNLFAKATRRSSKNVNGKGLALPIDTMVALAIAIVVLLALVAFFMGGVKSNTTANVSQQRFQSCCQGYVLGGCGGVPETHDCGVNEKGEKVNLAQLASAIQIYGDGSIRSACQCVGSLTTTTIPQTSSNSGATGSSKGTWKLGPCSSSQVEVNDCTGNPPAATATAEPFCCVNK